MFITWFPALIRSFAGLVSRDNAVNVQEALLVLASQYGTILGISFFLTTSQARDNWKRLFRRMLNFGPSWLCWTGNRLSSSAAGPILHTTELSDKDSTHNPYTDDWFGENPADPTGDGAGCVTTDNANAL